MDIPKSSDKPWYKSYDPNVPQTIDLIKYNSISDLLEVSFKNYPSSPGFYNFGESLSFLQINELSHAYAGYLQSELGLEKGDRIAIIMPNILQYPVCLFGAWLAGLVVVNVPFVNSSKEMKEKLTETGVKCVQVLSTHAHILETALPGTQVQHVIVTDFGDLFDFPKNILFNFTLKYIKKAVPKWLIHDYIPFSKAVHPRNIKNFKKPSIQQNDLALLSYTAGRSTGNPKCVMLSHRNLIANSQQCFVWSYSFFRNKYHEPILTPLPFFVVATITCSCLSSFRIGMSNHLITNPFDTMSMIQEMKQIPSSAMIGIPTLFNKLLDNEKFKTLDFSSLKFVFCGGMNVSPQLDSKWKSVTNTSILQAYGLEEASPIVMINPLSKKEFTGFLGLPVPSTEAKICDDKGNELPIGERGEIWIRGPQIMQGYWNQPEKTKEVLTEDGWFKTGDFGYMNQDGYFTLTDRREDLIYIGDTLIYPSEIEASIKKIEDVEEAVAISRKGPSGETIIKLYVQKRPYATFGAQEVFQHCKEHLPPHQMPHVIEFRDEFPLSPIGYIQRRVLRDEVKR